MRIPRIPWTTGLAWGTLGVGLLVFDQVAADTGHAGHWLALAAGLSLGGLLYWWLRAPVNTRTDAAPIAARPTEVGARHSDGLGSRDAFELAILNAVPTEIAVVEPDGRILAVNEPWRRFALENGPAPGRPAPATGVGSNYLEVCRTGAGVATEDDGATADAGIRAVLDGRLPSFTLEYPCHSPTQQRWFTMTVTPLGAGAGAVITHTDITQRKLLEEKRQAALSLLQKIANRLPGAVYQFRLRADGSTCLPFASEGLREIYRLSPQDVREDASPIFASDSPRRPRCGHCLHRAICTGSAPVAP